MANNCVNIKSREFKKLVVDTSLHPVVLSGKVSLWQDKNGVENYPTKEDIIDSFSNENVMFNINDKNTKQLTIEEILPTIKKRAKFHKINIETQPETYFKNKNTHGHYEISTNKIVLNEQSLNKSTLLHEIAHPFVRYIQAENPKLFKKLLKEADKEYPDIRSKISNMDIYKKQPDSWFDEEIVVRAVQKNYTDLSFDNTIIIGTDSIYQKFIAFIKDLFGIANKFDTSNIETVSDLYFTILKSELPKPDIKRGDIIAKRELQEKYNYYKERIDKTKLVLINLEKQLIYFQDLKIGSIIQDNSAPEGVDIDFKYTKELQKERVLDTLIEIDDKTKHLRKLKQDQLDYNSKYKTEYGKYYFNIDNNNPIKKLSKAEKLKNLTETFSIGTTGYFGKMLMVDIIKPKLKELGYTLKSTSNANGYYIVDDKGKRYIPAKKIKYTAPKWFKAPDYNKPVVKETFNVNKDLFGNDVMFQTETTEQPVDTRIDDAMTRLISELGIDLINYNEYAEYYEQKEGKKLTAVAVADMFNKVIAVKEGHADKSTLAHEVGHFIEFALHNDKRIMFAIENVQLTELWQQKSEQYMQEYNNDENKVRREIVGQLIGLSLSDNVKNEKASWKRLLLQIWNSFLELFEFGSKAKTTRIRNSIDAIAKETLKDSSNVKKGLESQVSNKNNVLFELDPKDFNNSRILEGELKNLKSALSIIVNKINVYKKAGTEEITTTERDLSDVLSKAIRDVDDRDVDDYNKNYVTMGLINFIARMEEEAQFIIERVDIIEKAMKDGVYNNELDQLSKLLKQMNDYMLVYEPLLEDLMPTVKKLRRNSTEDVELYDKILDAFDTINTGIKTMKKDYVKHTKFILMSVAKDIFNGMENLANNPVKLKRELDLFEAQLSEKVGDLSMAQTFIDGAGTSHDAVIKLIHRLYSETKEDTNKEVLDINRDIIDLHEDFVEAGGRTTKFMAELDKDGNVTGNIVGEYNEAQFNEAKKVFTTKLDKEYGLPEANTRDEYITRDKKWYALTESQRSSYWGAVEVWETNNTETSPKLKELLNTKYNNIIKSIIPLKHDRDILYALLNKYPNNKKDHNVDKKMMDELKESNKALYNNFVKVRLTFREWRSKREYADFAGNITYKKELAIPKLSIYGNKQYTSIMSNPIEKKYYEGMMKIRKDLLKSLPEEIINSMLMVQIRKDFIERIKTDPKRTMQESYKDAVEKRETDYGYGVKTFNEDKTQMKHIPIMHYRKLDNMKDLSLDFTAGMMILADMAINYKNNNKVINIVQITSDVLKVRQVFKATTGIEGGINKITDKFILNNTTALETVGGRGYLRFQEFVNTVFYNELKDDDQGTTFGFDTSKLADALIKYTAMNSLALNIYAGFNNVMLGNIMLREEAFVKEYIKHKDLLFATKTYWRELPSLMVDMLKLRSNNKMRLVFEELDVFQDHGQRIQEVNADRSNFGRMFSLSNMFIINKGGEHQIQGRLALGMMSNLKLKDKNGNEINFYDAYEVDNYRIKLMEGLTKENGKPFTEKDIKSFKIKLKKVNNDLHGIYNLTDRAVIQKYWQGRAVMLFRKWLRPGWNRRFQSHDYDFSLDKDIEGMYVTSTKFVVSLYKELQAAKLTFATAGEAYDKLEDWQKANIKRNIAEVGYFVALMVAGTLLASIAGDDDDDWLLNMSAYQANRLSTEIGFFVPIYNATQITTLIQSPSATINQLDKVIDLIKVIDPFIIGTNDPFFREYQSGRHKGETRFKIWSKRTIPMWDSVDSWFYPEEKLKFFTN